MKEITKDKRLIDNLERRLENRDKEKDKDEEEDFIIGPDDIGPDDPIFEGSNFPRNDNNNRKPIL